MRLRLLLVAFLSFSAHAADYRSVGEEGGILYDAPSREATPLYVVSQDYPLEVVVHLEAWTKVRDHTGALSWIETRSLVERHTVMVTATTAQALLRPEEAAPVSFVAVQDVALELLDKAAGGWLHVRHADGADGYLQSSAVWGE
jgi:SH3-like domain-containing protein